MVGVVQGNSQFELCFLPARHIPVIVDQQPIAVVAAYVDQTDDRNQFHRTFLIVGVSLCLLTGLSFSIPAIALYRRTKEKQRGDRRASVSSHIMTR